MKEDKSLVAHGYYRKPTLGQPAEVSYDLKSKDINNCRNELVTHNPKIKYWYVTEYTYNEEIDRYTAGKGAKSKSYIIKNRKKVISHGSGRKTLGNGKSVSTRSRSSGKGKGWHKESRRHSQSAVVGWSRRRR